MASIMNVTSNLKRYQRIAPFYDLLDLPFERHRYRAIRPFLFSGMTGQLLDAGIGTGRNYEFYPPEAIVSGIDISPAMLTRARDRCPTLAEGASISDGCNGVGFSDRHLMRQCPASFSVFFPIQFKSRRFMSLVASSSRGDIFAYWSTSDRKILCAASLSTSGNHGSNGLTEPALIVTPSSTCPLLASN